MKGFWRKAEEWVLFLLLLLLPTQLGKHFWPEWSLVMGVRVDYLAPTLYLVDLLWLGWLGTKLLNLKRPWKMPKIKEKTGWEMILGLGLVTINIIAAGNKWVALYRWLRIGQLLISYFLIKAEKTKVKKFLIKIIPAWIVTESLLGLAQMIKGGSLNGLWWWLGERRFELGNIAVAEMAVLGQGILRAYGTFSHPNSLAGFLLAALILWRWLKDKTKSLTFWWLISWLAVLGIIISGSRTAWAVLLIVIISSYGEKRFSLKKTIGVTAVTVGVFLLILGMMAVNYRTMDWLSGWDSEGLSKRIGLTAAALNMWRENFITGIGQGNFINQLPAYQAQSRFYWLQPVHNIFLLWATETGILGVIALVWFTQKLWFDKKRKFLQWLLLAAIIVTGMVDHYWLTLSQNMWMLALVLAVE